MSSKIWGVVGGIACVVFVGAYIFGMSLGYSEWWQFLGGPAAGVLVGAPLVAKSRTKKIATDADRNIDPKHSKITFRKTTHIRTDRTRINRK